MGKQKAPRRVAENEALSVGGQIRGSAQKLNLVAGLIRGKKAGDALKAKNKSKAQKFVNQLTTNANQANAQVLAFNFRYCRFEPSKYT